jgi:MFS family permease
MTEPTADKARLNSELPSPAYAWYTVAVLLVAYLTSFVDRTILTLLVDPIRDSLNISDLELSVLHGFAFAIFYAVLGIPIARYADSHNRVRLISLGILTWSAMTAVCGFSRSFLSMFVARVGVGIGQATLSPAAYSILSDSFPPTKLVRALSVYQTAIYAGTGIAMIIGGFVIAKVPAFDMPGYGPMESWQVVFLLIGLPGVLVAALMYTVHEPTRKGLMSRPSGEKTIPVREVVSFVTDRRAAYGFLMGAVAAKGLAFYGATAWLPSYFMRTFQWDVAKVGLWYGLSSIVFGALGINLGGVVAGWLRSRGYVDANLRVGLICLACFTALGVLAPLVPSANAAMVLYGGVIFFAAAPVGCQAAALQEITPNQMRAQVSAIYLFLANIFGIGLGPTFVAFFTDVVFRDDLAVGYSMAIVALVAGPIGTVFYWRALQPYRACYESATAGFQERHQPGS